MTDKTEIQTICESALNGSQFIVDIKINISNDINIYVDDFDGLAVEECKRISRFITAHFDRDIEDFSLEVSSPGLSKPFKVLKQYQKCINQEVETVLFDGEKFIGKLIEASDNYIIIETSIIKKVNNKKQTITEQTKIEYTNIKATKSVISFKQ